MKQRPDTVLAFYQVIGMIFVPHIRQLAAGLADILGVDDGSPESARHVRRYRDVLVWLDLDRIRAVQANAEAIDSAAGVDRAAILFFPLLLLPLLSIHVPRPVFQGHKALAMRR